MSTPRTISWRLRALSLPLLVVTAGMLPGRGTAARCPCSTLTASTVGAGTLQNFGPQSYWRLNETSGSTAASSLYRCTA